MVPNLKGFKLQPYVTHNTPKVTTAAAPPAPQQCSSQISSTLFSHSCLLFSLKYLFVKCNIFSVMFFDYCYYYSKFAPKSNFLHQMNKFRTQTGPPLQPYSSPALSVTKSNRGDCCHGSDGSVRVNTLKWAHAPSASQSPHVKVQSGNTRRLYCSTDDVISRSIW